MRPGNVTSDYLVDCDKDMKCFDQLDPRIREALRNTIFDIGAPQVRSTRNRIGVARTVVEITRIDTEHARATRVSTWGATYP